MGQLMKTAGFSLTEANFRQKRCYRQLRTGECFRRDRAESCRQALYTLELRGTILCTAGNSRWWGMLRGETTAWTRQSASFVRRLNRTAKSQIACSTNDPRFGFGERKGTPSSHSLSNYRSISAGQGQVIRDKCLKRVATMLTRRLRGMDTVARTGEEEFTIALCEVESVGAAGIVAQALLELFAIPLEVEQRSILLCASIGGAVYPDHGAREMQLWQDADAAMRRASTNDAENVELEDHMRAMLQEGGFLLHYQLQYHMNGQIRGVEALLRLPHPTLEYVSPDRFIPLAEASGLIHSLWKLVIEEACRQLTLWNKPGMTPVRIAVNVWPLQLMRSDFAAEVQQAILESGVDPALLEIEITERVVLNFDEVAKRMTEIAAMGIRFAVDDFSTGYASLQHLHRLPISTLKIDRSFIQRLCESSRSYPIVKSIIELAHSLKMQVIAEGVEDEDQMQLLRELKCDCIRGFLLSRPLPPEEIKVLLGN